MIEQMCLQNLDKCDTIETVAISIEEAKRLADHYTAIAQYWRKAARLPPMFTVAQQRKLAEIEHR